MNSNKINTDSKSAKNSNDSLNTIQQGETQNFKENDFFTNLFDTNPATTTKTSADIILPTSTSHVKQNQEFPQRSFPSVNTFSIDIDPFSSSDFQNPFDDNFVSTTHNKTEDSTKITKLATSNPFADPFDIGDFNSQDPFSVFNTVIHPTTITTTTLNNKMTSIDENEQAPLDFSKADELLADTQQDETFVIKNLDLDNPVESTETHFNERPIDLGEELLAEDAVKKNNYAFDDSSSDDDFNLPSSIPKKNSVDIVEIRDSFSEHNPDELAKPKVHEIKEDLEKIGVNDDEDDDDDDMDGAFDTFKHEQVKPVEDLPSLANEIKFDDFDINETNSGGVDFDEQMNLAMRKGETNFDMTNGLVFNGDIEDENEIVGKNSESIDENQNTKSTLKTAEDAQEEEDSTVSPYVNSSPLFNRGVKIKR